MVFFRGFILMNPNVRIFAGIVMVAGFLSLVLFAAHLLGFRLDEERC